MRLSVCIPTHHGRCALLAQTLASVAAQVPPGGLGFAVEVVVSDNASEDGTAAMVAAFAADHPQLEVVYGRNEENIRLANIARVVERASGEWCWLFGSDDVLVEGALELVAATIAVHPDASGIAVGRIDVDHELRERIAGAAPEVRPDAQEVTVIRGFAEIEDQLAFQHGFLGSNVVRRDRWLAAAGACAARAVRDHPDWPQLIVFAEMARRDPVWVWQPTVVLKARAGRPYVVEGDLEQPNLARMHVLLVGGLHGAWREIAGEDRALYRRLMRRSYAVAGSAEVVHHIKLSKGHSARWGVRLARCFLAAFWWDARFRRRALPRLLTPAPVYARWHAWRSRARRPMPRLGAGEGAVGIVPELPAAWMARGLVDVPCGIRNAGSAELWSTGEHAVQVGARWFAPDGADAVLVGPRVQLVPPLAPGATAVVRVPVPVPWEPGRYRLRIGAVQENVRWFGDADPVQDVVVDVEVRLPAPPVGPRPPGSG